MSLGSVFVGLALTLLSGVVLAEPYINKKLRLPSRSEEEGMFHKKNGDEILIALRDLDFDFNLEKITEEDYALVRMELMQEIAGTLQVQDLQNQKRDKEIETQVRNLRTPKHGGLVCHNCSAPRESRDQYCSRCGSRVN